MTISLSSRTAAAAVVTLFAGNGLFIGVWAGSIPALAAKLRLDAQRVAILFVAAGLAAITSMQVNGRLLDRFGARRPAVGFIPVLIVGILIVGLAPSYPWLVVGGVLLGLGNGGIDVSMNAMGVAVEKHRDKPIMSFFHGMWSVGNMSGAAIVLAIALMAPHDPALVVLIATGVAAAVGAAWFVTSLRITPETPVREHIDETGAKTPIPASAYLLGLMACAFGLGEGTAMDWSGLHLTEVAGVSPAQGSMAVTTVAAFMVAIRLLGDRLVSRFGRRAIVRFGGACSALGYFVTAVATQVPVLLLGWALVGFGIGMIAPQVYATAGHEGGGRGLAVVVTFGYATFLAGPAIIGFLVSRLGIQHTMFVPGTLLVGLLLLARIMPGRQQPG